MPFSRTLLFGVIMGSVVAGLAPGAASAQPAAPNPQIVTRFTTYMHSGPGLQFAVTDEIPNRTPLTPDACSAGWCRIRYGGVPGFVQQSTLITGPSLAQPSPGERPVECMDFARTGWPDQGNLDRVCIFKPNKPVEIEKPAG